jgi:hypothetical protein
MKKLILKTFALGLLVISIASCKKDSATASKSKTEYLTQKAWKIESLSISIAGASQNIPIDACQQDDSDLFAAAGTGTYDNGATKCNELDDQTSTFTWSFKENETIISIVGPNVDLSGDSKISILNDNTLEAYQESTANGITTRFTGRFKH